MSDNSPEQSDCNINGGRNHSDSSQSPAEWDLRLKIPKDLAVQIVGSDAGRQRRFCPNTIMAKDATTEELSVVQQLMQPFLDDEIKRFDGNGNQPRQDFEVATALDQALALKNICVAYAVHLDLNWPWQGGVPLRHRDKQMLDQTGSVIRQINEKLGMEDHDERPYEQFRLDILEQLGGLREQLSKITNLSEDEADA